MRHPRRWSWSNSAVGLALFLCEARTEFTETLLLFHLNLMGPDSEEEEFAFVQKFEITFTVDESEKKTQLCLFAVGIGWRFRPSC